MNPLEAILIQEAVAYLLNQALGVVKGAAAFQIVMPLIQAWENGQNPTMPTISGTPAVPTATQMFWLAMLAEGLSQLFGSSKGAKYYAQIEPILLQLMAGGVIQAPAVPGLSSGIGGTTAPPAVSVVGGQVGNLASVVEEANAAEAKAEPIPGGA